MTRRQLRSLPAVPPATRLGLALATVAPGAARTAAGTEAPLDVQGAAPGAHGAPDPALIVASLASAAAQLASHAQQLAELLAAGAGSSTSSLALLRQHEQSREQMDVTPRHAATTTESLMLSPREAAALLGVHVRTLQRLRAAGVGPKAVHIGSAVRYRRCHLERWLEGKRS